MTDKIIDGIDVSGCKFQTDCIEYKDISYLKIMPICAIHELSIACHDKVNKCKYYKLYTQLKRLEQENAKLKETLEEIKGYCEKCKKCVEIGDEVILYTVIKKVNEVLKDK